MNESLTQGPTPTLPRPTRPAHNARARASGGRGHTRPHVLLGVVLVAVFMGVLDSTIVNVAAPSIGTDLRVSGAGLQLVVAGYTIAYAVLIVIGARLGNRYGHRRAFLTGLTLFTTFSLACGLATDTAMLVAFRVVQGTGAAVMMPQVLSLLQRTFTGPARARALRFYTAVIATGAVLGQVLGGVIVSANLFGADWRPVFLINVPVGVVLLVLGARFLPRDRGEHNRRFDAPGTLVLAAAVLLLIIPLVFGHDEGWPAWCWLCLVASAVAFGGFALVERGVERRGGNAMVPSAVLAAPGLRLALASLSLGMMTYAGYLFACTLHMQSGLGYTPLRAGLLFAPAAVGFGAVNVGWRYVPARFHGPAIPAGLVVAAGSYAALAAIQHDGGAVGTASTALFLVLGVGLGSAFSPLLAAALAHVPVTNAADASGVVATCQQLSMATGIALFGSVYLSLAAHRHGTPAQSWGTPWAWHSCCSRWRRCSARR